MIEQDNIRVTYTDGEYHLATNKNGKLVPRHLFAAYQRVRELLNDLRADIKAYVNPPIDKPMRIEKNHWQRVEPGEVVKFPTSDEIE